MKFSAGAESEIKFVPNMPGAYFTFAEQIFHIENISLVPRGTNFIEKRTCKSKSFFLAES